MDTQTLLTLAVLVLGFIALGMFLKSQQRPADNAAAINEAVAQGLNHLIAANGTTTSAVGDQLNTVRQALDELRRQSSEWDARRAEAIGGLRSATEATQAQIARLNDETAGLSNAMRGNQTRGKWGEVSLRNIVESVGMVEHVDFNEQVQEVGAGTGRPDVTVKLPGGRVMYIDAKVPWSAYQESLGESDPAKRATLLDQNAKDIKGHINALADREYRKSLESLSQVIMFVPVESALSAALVTEPGLIAHATAKGVILASPASLILILSNFHQGWVLNAKLENVDAIAQASEELLVRLDVMVGHLASVGGAIAKAGEAFNSAIGSYGKRVGPQIRALDALLASGREARDIDPVEFEPKAMPSAAKEADRANIEHIRLVGEHLDT